jgi:acetolactate synthase I/II/III large subunit
MPRPRSSDSTSTSKLDTREWLATLDGYKKKYPLGYKKQGGLRMQQVIDELYNSPRARPSSPPTSASTRCGPRSFTRTTNPITGSPPAGAGTMGFGFPRPSARSSPARTRLVISISGDGGFQMTLFELATAAIHKLPIKIVVLNNHYLGMVRQWQELFFDDRESGVDLIGNPDFCKLAEAYGIKGVHIKRPADVTRMLEKALAYNDGPILIHAECVKTDNVFPMIPAGAALEDMLIEPPKHKMAKPVGST